MWWVEPAHPCAALQISCNSYHPQCMLQHAAAHFQNGAEPQVPAAGPSAANSCLLDRVPHAGIWYRVHAHHLVVTLGRCLLSCTTISAPSLDADTGARANRNPNGGLLTPLLLGPGCVGPRVGGGLVVVLWAIRRFHIHSTNV